MPGFGKQYDTVDDAAAAALMWLERQPRSDKMEYATYIYQDPDSGKFYRGGFQRGDSGHVGMEPPTEPGDLVALVHNHPLRNDEIPTTAFSTQDYQTGVDLHNILMYLAGMQKGSPSDDRKMDPQAANKIRVFTRTNDPHDPLFSTDAYEGKKFLAEYPIDEHLQYIQTRLMGRRPNDPRGAYLPDPLQNALADELDDAELRPLNLGAVLSSLK